MNFTPHPEQHYPHPSKTTFQDMERSPKFTIHNLSNELLITIFDFYRQDVKESYYRWSMRLGLVQAYTCFQKMAHRVHGHPLIWIRIQFIEGMPSFGGRVQVVAAMTRTKGNRPCYLVPGCLWFT